MVDEVERNAFEALCDRAAGQRWCWKIFCTTCGHMYFRYAFREIASGIHPDSQGWRVDKAKHHMLEHWLGPMPAFGGLNGSEQHGLASLLANASLKKIKSRGHFPDWLGYLGLGLAYSEQAEHRDRSVTNSWIPQLLEMVPPGAPSTSLLQTILADPGRVITWQSLEEVEWGLRFPS